MISWDYAHIGHAVRPSARTPEPGWYSQCRHPKCPGHWRTGLADEETARTAYQQHRCAAATGDGQ